MKIHVIVKTKAKDDLIEKIDNSHFKVCTKRIPFKGEANLAIIKILADYFNIPKSDIKIISGVSSKQKIIEISE